MYLACRHIKPNGLRCESPALRGHAFCYFHARLHDAPKPSVMDDVKLPLPEDLAAIQLSLARIFELILSSGIDTKRAGQLLYGLQIALQTVPRKWTPATESVETLTRTEDGDELAPEARICNGLDDCNGCPHSPTCPNYDPDEDDDDDDN